MPGANYKNNKDKYINYCIDIENVSRALIVKNPIDQL